MGPTTTFKLSWEAGAAQTSSPSWQRLGLAGKFALLDQASAQSMTGSAPACRVGSNESVVTSLIHRALHLPVGATSLTFINTNTDKKTNKNTDSSGDPWTGRVQVASWPISW